MILCRENVPAYLLIIMYDYSDASYHLLTSLNYNL